MLQKDPECEEPKVGQVAKSTVAVDFVRLIDTVFNGVLLGSDVIVEHVRSMFLAKKPICGGNGVKVKAGELLLNKPAVTKQHHLSHPPFKIGRAHV